MQRKEPVSATSLLAALLECARRNLALMVAVFLFGVLAGLTLVIHGSALTANQVLQPLLGLALGLPVGWIGLTVLRRL